jgi:predicted ribosomally synthesized peptide with nif11-like leader
MSVASAKAFLAKMKEDKSFAEKFKGVTDAEVTKKMLDDGGFSFNKEELKVAAAASGELSDDELEAVAGGLSISFPWLERKLDDLLGKVFK